MQDSTARGLKTILIAPDAIILDLEMPRMTGLEALKCLQADPQTADIPVVMLTQPADRAELVIDSVNRGAVDFVPKDDFADAVLLETMRQMGWIEPCAVEA